MTTLNEIAHSVTGKLNAPFDEKLNDEIKFAIKGYRALFLRRDLERNLPSAIYQQSFIIDLIKVDEIDSCKVDLGCLILRSENKVPIPVRHKGMSPFAVVSAASVRNYKDVYGYKTREEIPFQKFNKFSYEIIGYDYINGYIYLFGNKLLKYARLSDAFESPEEINSCASGDTCYSDDGPFPISKDMAQLIVDTIVQTYRNKEKDLQVKTDNKENG